MQNILITGATGNVGKAVLKHFSPEKDQQLFTAVPNPDLQNDSQLYLDFYDPEGAKPALAKTDVLFLLRPPQISDVNRCFEPLIKTAKEQGVNHIVFLSVQGADTISFIPHAKIEKLITNHQIPYTFIRPSYFMQNLTTQFPDDIRNHDRIFIPAGNAKFLWVDVNDIGKAIARVLEDSHSHVNQVYTITGKKVYTFKEIATMLSNVLGRTITYKSPNLLKFYLVKRKAGMPAPFIFVMIALHFLPRFSKPPRPSDDLQNLTGEEPTGLKEFIEANLEVWQP